MSFSIPNPEFTFRERVRIAIWAWLDSKIPGQPSISEGYFDSNRLKAIEAKAKEAISYEISERGNAKHFKALKGLYAQYCGVLAKLRRVQAERSDVVAKAKACRLPEDDELDHLAIAQRSSGRAAKCARPFDAAIVELENQLDSLAKEANENNVLAEYQSARVELLEHCSACAEHFYYRTANVYAQSLRRKLGIDATLRIRDLDDSLWMSEIDVALPVLDFTQHHNIAIEG